MWKLVIIGGFWFFEIVHLSLAMSWPETIGPGVLLVVYPVWFTRQVAAQLRRRRRIVILPVLPFPAPIDGAWLGAALNRVNNSAELEAERRGIDEADYFLVTRYAIGCLGPTVMVEEHGGRGL